MVNVEQLKNSVNRMSADVVREAVLELLDEDDTRHAFQYVLLARPSPLPHDRLFAANDAVPCEPIAPKPRPRGARSLGQRLQIRLFRFLLKRISVRRFRGR